MSRARQLIEQLVEGLKTKDLKRGDKVSVTLKGREVGSGTIKHADANSLTFSGGDKLTQKQIDQDGLTLKKI